MIMDRPRRRNAPRRPGNRARLVAFRPRTEELEGRRLLSEFRVTTTADSGPGSFRQAILDSNAKPGPDAITFAIAADGTTNFDPTFQTFTIRPTSPLPTITDQTFIDGYSQRFTGTIT